MRSDERGQSLIEVILLGLVLLVPLLWGLSALSSAHRGALAVSAAARDGGFALARASHHSEGAAAVRSAVAEAMRDHGLSPKSVRVRWVAPKGFQRGAAVEIEVRYPISLVDIPLLGSAGEAEFWVTARHGTVIERYASRD